MKKLWVIGFCSIGIFMMQLVCASNLPLCEQTQSAIKKRTQSIQRCAKPSIDLSVAAMQVMSNPTILEECYCVGQGYITSLLKQDMRTHNLDKTQTFLTEVSNTLQVYNFDDLSKVEEAVVYEIPLVAKLKKALAALTDIVSLDGYQVWSGVWDADIDPLRKALADGTLEKRYGTVLAELYKEIHTAMDAKLLVLISEASALQEQTQPVFNVHKDEEDGLTDEEVLTILAQAKEEIPSIKSFDRATRFADHYIAAYKEYDDERVKQAVDDLENQLLQHVDEVNLFNPLDTTSGDDTKSAPENSRQFNKWLEKAPIKISSDAFCKAYQQNAILKQQDGYNCGCFAAFNAWQFVEGALGNEFSIQNRDLFNKKQLEWRTKIYQDNLEGNYRTAWLSIGGIGNIISNQLHIEDSIFVVESFDADLARTDINLQLFKFVRGNIKQAQQDHTNYQCAFIVNTNVARGEGSHWICFGLIVQAGGVIKIYQMDSGYNWYDKLANYLYQAVKDDAYINQLTENNIQRILLREVTLNKKTNEQVKANQLFHTLSDTTKTFWDTVIFPLCQDYRTLFGLAELPEAMVDQEKLLKNIKAAKQKYLHNFIIADLLSEMQARYNALKQPAITMKKNLMALNERFINLYPVIKSVTNHHYIIDPDASGFRYLVDVIQAIARRIQSIDSRAKNMIQESMIWILVLIKLDGLTRVTSSKDIIKFYSEIIHYLSGEFPERANEDEYKKDSLFTPIDTNFAEKYADSMQSSSGKNKFIKEILDKCRTFQQSYQKYLDNRVAGVEETKTV